MPHLPRYRGENVGEETRLIISLGFEKEKIFLIVEEGHMYLIHYIFLQLGV